MNFGAEVVKKCELVRLGRCLKNNRRKTKRLNEPIGKSKVQLSIFVEETDALRTLPGLDYELSCSGIEPSLALLEQLAYCVTGEGTSMFLSQLELDLEPPLVRHSHDVTGLYTKICKPLSALDTTYSYIGTQVEVSRKLALGCCYLERSPPVTVGTPYLVAASIFCRVATSSATSQQAIESLNVAIRCELCSRWLSTVTGSFPGSNGLVRG